MSRPWRNLALSLFVFSLVIGSTAGNRLLAVSAESQQQMSLYTELLHAVHENFGEEVHYRELVYGSIDGMLRTLDPHTNFLSPEAYANMRERQQGSFYGLGILISKRNGQLTVISPIEGTPAWRLGLKAGDVISIIEGQSTDAMSLDDAVKMLKGPKGTQVSIKVSRGGLDDLLDLTITRDEIPQNTVRFAYMMTPEAGYIRLTDFSRSTTSEISEALVELRDQGMKSLILDLRSNGGGLLDQTINVSNFFVPEKSKIVETRGRLESSDQSFSSSGADEPIGIPLVVLVNQGTASAAEILAGAIQDHDTGLILGTPTWGKGLVQTVYNLSYGAGIALTTAKYYTPSGRLIQRDYSSFYDYYSYFEPEEAETTPPADITFRTDLGRPVYSGGGIAPDELIEAPTAPAGVQSLFARNSYFEFAVDYALRTEIEDETWQPSSGLLSEFQSWLSENEIEVQDELFEDEHAREMMTREIHADLFNSAFGTEAAHRVRSAGDVQIQRALELFDDAAALLAKRQVLGDQRVAELTETTPPALESAETLQEQP